MAIQFFYSSSYSSPIKSAADPEAHIRPIGIRAYVDRHCEAFSPDFDIPSIVSARKGLAHSVKFYGERLARLDPVSFNYFDNHQRIACEEELLYTFYILSAEYQLYLFEGNNHRVKKRANQLQRCTNLLNTLRNMPLLGEKKSLEQGLQDMIDDSPDKPAAYIALRIIAPEIAETMLSISMAERFSVWKKTMSDANFYRLNWVWGGGLDHILLDLMPSGIGRSQQARDVFADISPVTGYMSWVLYYFRLGIELYLLTKYTIKGSWMDPWASKEDKAVPLGLSERFQTQWELRKFSILNDAFWATANMACFFWLVGSGTLGYVGDALTGVLLIFDLTLVAWGYQEKKTEYTKTMQGYDEDIKILREKIHLESDEAKSMVLKEHCKVLVEAREQYAFEWKYVEKQWVQDLWYAASLFAAFSMLCCFFFPPATLLPVVVLILGITGSALSFLITIGAHALETSIEIEKLQAASAKAELKLSGVKNQLSLLKSDKSIASDSAIKGLELDIKHRQEDLAYQKAMINFHKTEIVQQTLSEALVPATAFAILVFLPLGYGLFVLIPTVAALMASGHLLGLNKPEEPDSPDDSLPMALSG